MFYFFGRSLDANIFVGLAASSYWQVSKMQLQMMLMEARGEEGTRGPHGCFEVS